MPRRTDFDPERFLSLWRQAEPKFRASLVRYGIVGDAADDVTQEILQRIVSAGQLGRDVGSNERQLVRFAEAVAINFIRDRLREDERRPRLEFVADDLPQTTDAEERGVLRQTIRERLAGLSAHDRDALSLILRGGPYSSTETSKMSRARARLLAAFEDLLAVSAFRVVQLKARFKAMRARFADAPLRVVRARPRLHAVRARFGDAPPIIPATAGAFVGALLGGFTVLGALPGPLSQPERPAPSVRPSQSFPAASWASSSSAGPTTDHHRPANPTDLADAMHPGRPATSSVPITTGVGLSHENGRESADFTIAWDANSNAPGSFTSPVVIHCDSAVRRLICVAASNVPSAP